MTFDFNKFDIDAGVKKILDLNAGDPPALMPDDEINKLITGVANKIGCSGDTAYIGVCLICQKGGTAKRAQGNIFIFLDGVRIDLAAIRQVMNDLKLRCTLRQFPRTHCDKIYQIASHFSIEGDLAKKICRRYQTLSSEDKIWLANFQMDNPNCPSNLRDYLMEHYDELFPGRGK